MYLKYNINEVTWVSHEELILGCPIAGFWVNTDDHHLYCAYYNNDQKICWHYFDVESRKWIHTKTFD